MAKQQNLSLNPSKLSGMCGRLKCCLRYELPNGKGVVHGGCADEGGCGGATTPPGRAGAAADRAAAAAGAVRAPDAQVIAGQAAHGAAQQHVVHHDERRQVAQSAARSALAATGGAPSRIKPASSTVVRARCPANAASTDVRAFLAHQARVVRVT